jgi:hypothetical protein
MGLLLILNWIAIQGRCSPLLLSHSFGNEHDAVVLYLFLLEYNTSLFPTHPPYGICLLIVLWSTMHLGILDNLVSVKRSHLGYANARGTLQVPGWFKMSVQYNACTCSTNALLQYMYSIWICVQNPEGVIPARQRDDRGCR